MRESLDSILKTLPEERVEELLRIVEPLLKKSSKKKTASKGKRVHFPDVVSSVKINNFFRQLVRKEDILQHFTEEKVCDLATQPPYAVKAQIVSMYEMLANTEEKRERRDSWRRKAAQVIMIDSQETLFSYVSSMATGIRTS